MIKSISEITGTGKFLNFQNDRIPIEKRLPNFQKFNLIYAENGMGKTTFSLLLKSLKERPGLMLKKRSFDKKVAQTATLLIDKESYTFENNNWNQYFTNLEVFDVHFINENIYTGLEIQASHKKNLFEIILGDGGIELKLSIQTLKQRIFNGKKVVRETSKFIEQQIGNIYAAYDYAALLPDPNIEEKVEEKRHELETANGFQLILETAVLSTIATLSTPYEKDVAKAILQKSIDNISAEYLEKIKQHKAHLKMEGNPEDWLKEGFKNAGKNCPFCQQPLKDAMEIIEAYQQYFNEEYNGLLIDLVQVNQSLQAYNLAAHLLEIEQQVLKNIGLSNFWKKYLPTALDFSDFKIEKDNLIAYFEKIKAIFKEKTANPIQPISSKSLIDFENLTHDLNEKIVQANAQITNFNSSIALMKAADNPNLSQIELQLKQLEAQRIRGNTTMIENCDNLLVYQQGLNKLEIQKTNKQAELTLFQRSVFKDYLIEINQYLQAFAPYLKIEKLSSGYQGSSTEPVVKFALKVHQNTVTHKESATKPSMKFALSEGDKSALALSFFMAKLAMDENLSQKIIVFDDAISSFDRHRLSKLLDFLISIGQKAEQVFFLTHNFRFGKEFLKRTDAAGLPNLSCKIEAVGPTSGLVKN
ncbi:MAG: wobble nucleotide-excising tRNase [Paraglaciecola sp.]|jgi:wobble nucleotide-excising tRNase